MLTYLMELGNQLPLLAPQHKTAQNTIQGCLSTVWLVYKQQGDRLYFEADSNTAITKGLISLLVRVLSGQRVADIMAADLYLLERLGMHQLIGSQRTSGFASMVKQIKLIAVAQQAKLEHNN